MKNLIQEWRRIKASAPWGRRDNQLALRRVMKSRVRASDLPRTDLTSDIWHLRLLRRLGHDIADSVCTRYPGSERGHILLRHADPVDLLALLLRAYPEKALPYMSEMGGPSRFNLRHCTTTRLFLESLGLEYHSPTEMFIRISELVTVDGRRVHHTETYPTRLGLKLRDQSYPVKLSTLPKPEQKKHPASCITSDGTVYLAYEDFEQHTRRLEYSNEQKRYLYTAGAPKPFQITGLGSHGSSGSRLMYVLPNGTGARMGYEWEMSVLGRRKPTEVGIAVAQMMNEVAQTNYTLVERDGSVTDGFELVVASTRLSEHRKVLNKLHEKVKGRGYRTNPYARCQPAAPRAGIHVHISRKDTVNPAAMNYFLNMELPNSKQDRWGNLSMHVLDDSKRLAFYKHIIGRLPNRYCTPRHSAFNSEDHRANKFVPMNVQHSATYELRIFGPTNDPKRIISYLEFTQALADWTANFIGVPTYRIKIDRFIEFVCQRESTYPELALSVRKFMEVENATE